MKVIFWSENNMSIIGWWASGGLPLVIALWSQISSLLYFCLFFISIFFTEIEDSWSSLYMYHLQDKYISGHQCSFTWIKVLAALGQKKLQNFAACRPFPCPRFSTLCWLRYSMDSHVIFSNKNIFLPIISNI